MGWSHATACSQHLVGSLDWFWTNARCTFCLSFVSTARCWLWVLANRAGLVAPAPRGHRGVDMLLFWSWSRSLLYRVSVHWRWAALFLAWDHLSVLVLWNTSALAASHLLILGGLSGPHVRLVVVIANMAMWWLLWRLLLVFVYEVIVAWRVTPATELLLVFLLLLLARVSQWVTLLRGCLLLSLWASWAWSLTFFRGQWTLIHTHIGRENAWVHLLGLTYLVFGSDSTCRLSSTWLRNGLFAKLLFFCLFLATSLGSLLLYHKVLLLRRLRSIFSALRLCWDNWRLSFFLNFDFLLDWWLWSIFFVVYAWHCTFGSNPQNRLDRFSHLIGFFAINIVILLFLGIDFIDQIQFHRVV